MDGWNEWFTGLTFSQMICLIGCLAVSAAIVIGATRGRE